MTLTAEQVASYRADGFVHPIRVLDDAGASDLRAALDDHLRADIPTDAYELTDPIAIRATGSGEARRLEYVTGGRSAPHTFPFLFNIWRFDDRFRRVAFDSGIADLARQLLDCSEVLLMEDNAIVKYPHTGTLPWHQDLGYWPIAEPEVVTVWIALDPMTPHNGGMQLVPGSQRRGERLPVDFGTGASLLADERPHAGTVPVDPAAEGHPVVSYLLAPGEAGLHDPLVWHASWQNDSDAPRCAYALRYLRSGAVWWGDRRMPYDDIGCRVGERVDGRHFPAV